METHVRRQSIMIASRSNLCLFNMSILLGLDSVQGCVIPPTHDVCLTSWLEATVTGGSLVLQSRELWQVDEGWSSSDHHGSFPFVPNKLNTFHIIIGQTSVIQPRQQLRRWQQQALRTRDRVVYELINCIVMLNSKGKRASPPRLSPAQEAAAGLELAMELIN